jgi:uncharacterized protein YjbI with pentapeptide repeats
VAGADQASHSFAANLNAGTSLLLFAYVEFAVLRQSDAELILPNSTFDLGGLIDKFKDGVPGGAFVAPILQIKFPLYVFYTVGPVVLVALHAALVLRPSNLRGVAPSVRSAVIWLPPIVMALIIWRFKPYLAARPEPPLAGLAMEGLQYLALMADAAIVIFSFIYALADHPSDLPGQSDRCVAAMLRAIRHAAIIGLVMLFLIGFRPEATFERQSVFSEQLVGALTFLLGFALTRVWLREGWFVSAQARAQVVWPWYRPMFVKEDLDMQGRILFASFFLGLMVFPASGRGLDLSGESLVARGPSELMLAAVIVASKDHGANQIANAREAAWIEYGRGITLDRWKFDYARFDRADMAHIRLRGANLRSASLEYANLIKADFVGADFRGASLRYSDLRDALGSTARLSGRNPPSEPEEAASSGAEASILGETTSGNSRSTFGGGDSEINNSVFAQANPPSANAGAETTEATCAKIKRDDRVDFSGADLSGANLTDADLTCSILRGVKMDSKTRLNGTKLDGANFCAATLSGVDLSVANGATSAIFAHTDLTRAKIPTNMTSSRLQGAFVKGVRFAPNATKPLLNNSEAMNLTQKDRELEPIDKRLSHCDEKGDPGNVPPN